MNEHPTQASRGASPRPLALGLAIAAMCLIWGSTWVVIKGGLHDLPPFSSAGVRFALASLGMALVAHLLARHEGGCRPKVWLVLFQGCVNFAPSYALVYWCETRLPSGLVAVLWAVYPLFVAVLGHFLLPQERMHSRQISGFLVGFAGVVVIHQGVLNIRPEAALAAALLLGSPLLSAFGTVIVKRHASHVSSVLLCRDAFGLSGLLLLLLAFLTERDAPLAWTPQAIFSILYLALFGTIVAFGLFWWTLRYASAASLSLIAYVVPVLALLLGWLAEGEELELATLCGGLLILAGVLLATRKKPHPPSRENLHASP